MATAKAWCRVPLNLFLYFSYVITIALYATGFAAYAVTFIDLRTKVWAVGVVLAFTAINFLGARTMGRAESAIVIIKIGILVMFIAAAFIALPDRGLTPVYRQPPGQVLWRSLPERGCSSSGYEGFGLITNAAANMANPRRELPRAIYGSVGLVIIIYVLVATGVVTNVPLDVLERSFGDSALAVAAKPSLDKRGFDWSRLPPCSQRHRP